MKTLSWEILAFDREVTREYMIGQPNRAFYDLGIWYLFVDSPYSVRRTQYHVRTAVDNSSYPDYTLCNRSHYRDYFSMRRYENLTRHQHQQRIVLQHDTYLRSAPALELNLAAVTTLHSLGLTAPTATSSVSTTATSLGGAVKIAARPNSTESPFAPPSRNGLCPQTTIPNSMLTTCPQLRSKQTHNLLFSPSTTRRGQRRWRTLKRITSLQSFSNLGTLPANRSTKLDVNTTQSGLSTRTNCRAQPLTPPKSFSMHDEDCCWPVNDNETSVDLNVPIHAREVSVRICVTFRTNDHRQVCR